MNKLIVETKNAPMMIVGGIMVTWSELAALVEQNVALPKGCGLEWELVFQHVSQSTGWAVSEDTNYWQAYGAIRMVFEARIGGIDTERQTISVPMTEVEEVFIFDDGNFDWHNENGKAKPADDLVTIKRLAKAVCEGKLPSGHHYRCNWIPSFDSSKG